MSVAKPQRIFWMVAIPAFLLAFGLSALRTFIIPKLYSSTARVELKGLAGRSDLPGFFQTQATIMQSDAFLGKVSDRLDLETVWGKRLKLDGNISSWEVLMLLKRGVEVSPAKEAGVLEIRYFGDDKFEAARIANEIARLYCTLTPDASGGIQPVLRDRAVQSDYPAHPNIPLRLAFGAGAALVFAIGLGGLASWFTMRLIEAPMSDGVKATS